MRDRFDVRVYDSRALAGIDPRLTEQDEIHRRFVDGGIERAAVALTAREGDGDPPYVLAFSIGGAVAWRAVAAGLPCRYFVAVSATRLRKETLPLLVPGLLIYGEQDAFRPNDEWPARPTNFTSKIIPKVGHECYRSPEFAARAVRVLLAE